MFEDLTEKATESLFAPLILGSMLQVRRDLLSDNDLRQLKRRHTLRVEMPDMGFGGPKILIAYQDKPGKYIHIPRQSDMALDLLSRYRSIDARSPGTPITAQWNGKFRDGQREFILNSVKGLRRDADGLGIAGCGFGKTVCGSAIACAMGTTTLIGVHKKKLMDQWVTAFQNFCGITPGIVQGPICDIEGKQVVIAMIQTLASDGFKPPQGFFTWPGLTIWDECHRMSAPTFASAIASFPSKYRLGLTATPRRGDKMEDVFYWHLGDIFARGEGEFLDCMVWAIKTGCMLDESQYFFRGRPNMGKMITALTEIPERNDLIVRVATKAALAGRRVLLLSHRVKHCQLIADRLNTQFKAMGLDLTAGFLKSGTSKKAALAQDEAAKCTVTTSTWPMASEGLDLPDKDSLICTTPVSDVEQAAGRIRRLLEGKKDPHIYDLCDNLGICWGQWKKRRDFYVSRKRDKEPWDVRMVG